MERADRKYSDVTKSGLEEGIIFVVINNLEPCGGLPGAKKQIKKFAGKFIKTEYGWVIVKRAKAGVIKLTSDDLKADVIILRQSGEIKKSIGCPLCKKIIAEKDLKEANSELKMKDTRIEHKHRGA